jgi:hypothetical protein
VDECTLTMATTKWFIYVALIFNIKEIAQMGGIWW